MDNAYYLGRKIVFILICFSTLGFLATSSWPEEFPALDPPKVDSNMPTILNNWQVLADEIPTMEWTLHKTADGAHPDGNEQQYIWLMNAARTDPSTEGLRLATTDEPSIAGARDFFAVDVQVLQDEFAEYSPIPPGAFDVRLYNAARDHSEFLIGIDDQNHDQQFDRVNASGFEFISARGNVFSFAESAYHGHAGWNIDWGFPSDGTGMQVGRGHRMAVMSLDGNYTNVGVAAVPDSDTGTEVGPLVVTGNYCEANTNAVDHYNRFLVGTVWKDQDGDSMYDPGEGIGGVTVMPDHGSYYAVTGTAGGYAIPVLSQGDYNVALIGDGISDDLQESVSIGADSVLLDFLVGECSAVDGRADIFGTVTYNGTPVCAMVLANGQFMFTCGENLGVFNLNVPVDQNCNITLFAFVSGLAPSKEVLGPEDAMDYDVLMAEADEGSKEIQLTWQTSPGTTNPTWVRIIGTASSDGTPLNAMILANGQSMFSNGTISGLEIGDFDLEVPLDPKGQITIFGFAQGFAPFRDVFTFTESQ